MNAIAEVGWRHFHIFREVGEELHFAFMGEL
jgi:hypothetical protein